MRQLFRHPPHRAILDDLPQQAVQQFALQNSMSVACPRADFAYLAVDQVHSGNVHEDAAQGFGGLDDQLLVLHHEKVPPAHVRHVLLDGLAGNGARDEKIDQLATPLDMASD